VFAGRSTGSARQPSDRKRRWSVGRRIRRYRWPIRLPIRLPIRRPPLLPGPGL